MKTTIPIKKVLYDQFRDKVEPGRIAKIGKIESFMYRGLKFNEQITNEKGTLYRIFQADSDEYIEVKNLFLLECMMDSKVSSLGYREFIKRQFCLGCSSEAKKIAAHHELAMGKDHNCYNEEHPKHFTCLPLCHDTCHTGPGSRHDLGKEFWAIRKIDPWKENFRLLVMYMTGLRLDMKG